MAQNITSPIERTLIARIHRTLSAMGLTLHLGLIGAMGASGQTIKKTGILPEILAESSGVAASRQHSGVLWTHNDSGHEPRLYATDLNGSLLAEFAVAGAEMVDWEDISIGKCHGRQVSLYEYCIYIADTGDNLARRETVQLYVIPEPNPVAEEHPASVTAFLINFAYSGGPADVEAMAVDASGIVWLATKGRRSAVRLYSLDLRGQPPGRTDQANIAMVADTLPLPRIPFLGWVTAAAISPSGRRLILRTYVEVYGYLRNRDGLWELTPPVCPIGAIEPQGEAIDFLDESTLVLTSEALPGRPGPIHTVDCF